MTEKKVLPPKQSSSRSDDDIGHTVIVQHRIDLIDEKPFKQRYRRIPQAAYDDVRAHLRQLLNAGIIQPSKNQEVRL
jgi:hypothetical protein